MFWMESWLRCQNPRQPVIMASPSANTTRTVTYPASSGARKAVGFTSVKLVIGAYAKMPSAWFGVRNLPSGTCCRIATPDAKPMHRPVESAPRQSILPQTHCVQTGLSKQRPATRGNLTAEDAWRAWSRQCRFYRRRRTRYQPGACTGDRSFDRRGLHGRNQ